METDSVIFGRVRRAEEHENDDIEYLVDEVPIDVFQSLNKKLNVQGLCLKIDTIEED